MTTSRYIAAADRMGRWKAGAIKNDERVVQGQRRGRQDPELVIGVVTPIGTDTQEFTLRIRGALAEWSYDSTIIKLSDWFGSRPPTDRLEHEDERVQRLIEAGNKWARDAGSDFGVAPLAVHAIGDARRGIHVSRGAADSPELERLPVSRHAFILHSLKRPGEVELLRDLYGPYFVLFSTQSPEPERKKTLMGRLATRTERDREVLAEELMSEDEKQTDTFGQAVQQTYHQADVFIGTDRNPDRAIALLFGDPRIAPDVGEHAMYLAEATSATSLSTSRRVGAAIVSADRRSVVAVGVNEVPQGSPADALIGYDYSDLEKKSLTADVLTRLAEHGWLTDEKKTLLTENPGKFEEEGQAVLAASAIGRIIEFQRAVHAEMWAILDAARRGVSLAGTTMYCNTYPCHLCWKHIPSAGIKMTYYIEPYPKSRASAMYESTVGNLKPFVGVAPRAFITLFANRDLPKIEPSSGRIQTPDRENAVPIAEKVSPPDAIPEREAATLRDFSEAIRLVSQHKERRMETK